MRKVCVVTGSRAEYGLLQPLMRELEQDSAFTLQLAVTGMHLAPAFDLTYRTIEADGFVIDAKVEMLLDSDSRGGVAKSLGLGVIGFADAFERLDPDIVVVLGDRFEILAAAQAAMIHRIPLAHLHGGEVTEGAMDESIRHAITKMASLHFVAAETFRKRVIQLGESPDRIFVVGATGLDAIATLELLDRAALEAKLDFKFEAPTFLVTYHPETAGGRDSSEDFRALLLAIEAFPEASVLFTGSNADPGNRTITELTDGWLANHRDRARGYGTLGQQIYLSLLRTADLVLGNSSSAIIEAPALRTPAVNIGDRQKGRPRAASIIDCAPEAGAIKRAIDTALDPEYMTHGEPTTSAYGEAGAAGKIKAVLKGVALDDLLAKPFHDVAFQI